MSRSYKKHPIFSDGCADKKTAKRRANKKIRSTNEILDGKQYRKISESWNIADYRFHWTETEARNWYRNNPHLHSQYKNENEYIKKEWFPYFKRK